MKAHQPSVKCIVLIQPYYLIVAVFCPLLLTKLNFCSIIVQWHCWGVPVHQSGAPAKDCENLACAAAIRNTEWSQTRHASSTLHRDRGKNGNNLNHIVCGHITGNNIRKNGKRISATERGRAST